MKCLSQLLQFLHFKMSDKKSKVYYLKYVQLLQTRCRSNIVTTDNARLEHNAQFQCTVLQTVPSRTLGFLHYPAHITSSNLLSSANPSVALSHSLLYLSFPFFFPNNSFNNLSPRNRMSRTINFYFQLLGQIKYLDYIFVVAIHCRGDGNQAHLRVIIVKMGEILFRERVLCLP